MKLWCLYACIVFLTAKAFCGSCPNGWVTFEDSCYSFIKTRETWPEASKICCDLGSNLVTIETADENKFVTGFLQDLSAAVNYLLSRAEIGENVGTFGVRGRHGLVALTWLLRVYGNGDKFGYTDWYPTEPDSHQGHDEDCAFIEPPKNWQDGGCNEYRSYICEKLAKGYTAPGLVG